MGPNLTEAGPRNLQTMTRSFMSTPPHLAGTGLQAKSSYASLDEHRAQGVVIYPIIDHVRSLYYELGVLSLGLAIA
jgi:hypothetical protein